MARSSQEGLRADADVKMHARQSEAGNCPGSASTMSLAMSRAGGRAFTATAPRSGCKLHTRPTRHVRVRAQAAALDPDNTSILVAGEGPLVIDITRRLKDMGSWVYVLQQQETYRGEIEKMMAFVVKGDAGSRADVDKAFEGFEEVDAVVTTLGAGAANANIIEAAVKRGIKKVVLVAAESSTVEQQLEDQGHGFVTIESGATAAKSAGSPIVIVQASSEADSAALAVKSLFL